MPKVIKCFLFQKKMNTYLKKKNNWFVFIIIVTLNTKALSGSLDVKGCRREPGWVEMELPSTKKYDQEGEKEGQGSAKLWQEDPGGFPRKMTGVSSKVQVCRPQLRTADAPMQLFLEPGLPGDYAQGFPSVEKRHVGSRGVIPSTPTYSHSFSWERGFSKELRGF